MTTLEGGAGVDLMQGYGGNDRLFAGKGDTGDTADCGEGTGDFVSAHPTDLISGCEASPFPGSPDDR